MFKRTFWFTVGTGVGLGSSWYVQQRVKRAAAQLPERVQREVTDAAKRNVTTVKEAAAEGKAAAAARTAELTDRVARRTARPAAESTYLPD